MSASLRKLGGAATAVDATVKKRRSADTTPEFPYFNELKKEGDTLDSCALGTNCSRCQRRYGQFFE